MCIYKGHILKLYKVHCTCKWLPFALNMTKCIHCTYMYILVVIHFFAFNFQSDKCAEKENIDLPNTNGTQYEWTSLINENLHSEHNFSLDNFSDKDFDASLQSFITKMKI